MKSLKIRGVIVPMFTPFTADGALDVDAIGPLVDFLIERGIAGLFPLGTNGEGPLLTTEERQIAAKKVVEATRGRVPVILHTGAITTSETVTLSRHAQEIGADGVAIIPPYFFKLTDEALFDHVAKVAQAVPDLPVYLYNNPGVTPNILSTEMVFRLAESFANITGLKDSAPSLATLYASRHLRGGSFNTASGPDGMIFASQAIGIDACVAGHANFVPELVVSLQAAAQAGDLVRARELQDKLDNVRRIMADGSDLSLFKAMCTKRGVPIGDVRPPLRPTAREKIETAWEGLLSAGVIP